MDLFIQDDSPVFKAIHPSKLSEKTGRAKMRFILTILVLTCIYLLMGCFHTPASNIPPDWQHVPTDMKSVADVPGQALLQVIIVYGHFWSHHSALRLVCPDRPVVFWDPSGSYGKNFPEEVRSKDLIIVNPPDLEMYLQQHIWSFTSLEVKVFEWDLQPEYARQLYDVLANGTDSRHPAGRFTTKAPGMFCTVKLSEFLHRFAGKTMIVRKSYFFPHSLAKVLYTQSPKRVLAFRRGKQTIYVPPRILSDNPG